MLKRVDRFIQENALFGCEDAILACVSGGVDSMVMLDILRRMNVRRLAVAHCNFGLRGDEADAETKMVEAHCAKIGIECFVARFDTQASLLDGESIQMGARRLRYDFFDQVAQNEGFNKIAVAHNFDDKIETFFINLTRGAGLRGLQGMAVENGKVVRPLLGVTREQILVYAKENKVEFLNDSSNDQDKYLRNRLRHSVLPVLREVASFDVAMKSVFENLSSEYEFIEECVDQKLEEFDLNSASKYLLFRYLERFGFSADVAGQVYQCAQKKESGKRFYSSTHVALLNRGELIIKQLSDNCGELKFEVENFAFCGDMSLVATEDVAFFDADKIQGKLYAKLVEPGDRFVPFGMKGSKLVNDFLKDEKVDLLAKRTQWLICSGEDICWVVGKRTDDRFKVDKNTSQIIKIKIL